MPRSHHRGSSLIGCRWDLAKSAFLLIKKILSSSNDSDMLGYSTNLKSPLLCRRSSEDWTSRSSATRKSARSTPWFCCSVASNFLEFSEPQLSPTMGISETFYDDRLSVHKGTGTSSLQQGCILAHFLWFPHRGQIKRVAKGARLNFRCVKACVREESAPEGLHTPQSSPQGPQLSFPSRLVTHHKSLPAESALSSRQGRKPQTPLSP